MTKIAVLQSNYIPWKGYFDIIHDVDIFVFYDDVQYTKGDWRNRNRIKTQQGSSWLTIPTGTNINNLIHQITLPSKRWQKKHWKTIVQNYSRAPYFKKYRSFFEKIYLQIQWDSLSELNQFLIKSISKDFLNINTEFQDSRNYKLSGSKSERLLNLITAIKADTYISGPAAKQYMDEKIFKEKNILIKYKDYSGYPEYAQFFPPFVHEVSIIDLLFHTGEKASEYIWGCKNNE